MFPLAAQSVYPRLVVKKAAARTDRFQESTKNYFPYYDIGDKLTEPNPMDYTIENLPNTVYSLPKGSIFDKITFLPNDLPDFRVVPVEGSKRSKINNASSTNGTPTPVIVETRPPTTFTNRGNKGYPIFKVSAVDNADSASLGDTSDTDIERLLELGSKPLALDETAVKRFVGTDYTALEIMLVDGSINYNDQRTKESVMAKASKYLTVPRATVHAVLSGKNQHLNKDTLKVGILYTLITSMDNTIVSRVSDDVANKLATLTNNAVDRVH